MMNKVKIMFVYLCFMVSLIGVGYAVWGENVEVGSVVKTGDLDVRFVSNKSYPTLETDSFVKPSLTIDKYDQKDIRIILKDMYPGAEVKFGVKGMNFGSIPSSFSFADSQISGDIELLPYLKYHAGIEIDNNGDGLIDWSCSTKGLLKNMAEDLNREMNMNKLNYLEPNGAGVFYLNVPKNQTINDYNNGQGKYILIKFDENAPNNTQNKSLEYRLNLNFKQYSNV